MTDRSKLLALAEAVEKLTGPDRETDCLIWWHVGPGKPESGYDGQSAILAAGYYYGRKPWVSEENLTIADVGYRGPSYTASLDAAMTLVPEGWQCDRAKWWAEDGASVELIGSQWDGESWVHIFCDGRVRGDAFTPALALCAAALRAQAEALS